jgi:hypothetical protein
MTNGVTSLIMPYQKQNELKSFVWQQPPSRDCTYLHIQEVPETEMKIAVS